MPRSTAKPKVTPNFRRIVGDLSKGTVLKPLLHSYLFDARFPGISLDLPKQDEHALAKGPDGWFHPSTHPMWGARLLWYYQHEPQAILTEPKEYMGTMSILFGTLTHKFVQLCLADMGVLVAPTVEQILNGEEPEAIAEDTRSRGHFDGELDLVMPEHPELTRQLFEFKTRSPMAKLPEDLDLEWFKEKHPEYYAQVQDYMRMTGLRIAIVLMMWMGYPWELREFHVPYDHAVAQGLATKYRRALDVEVMPEPCCNPRSAASKICPARGICPVARA